MKTYRTYIRYPATQRVSHKTTTWSREVADASFELLLNIRPPEESAASMTCDGENVKYVPLTEGTDERR